MKLGPLHADDPAVQVYRNLALRPHWWEAPFVRLFGEKSTAIKSGVRVTTYRWRGKIFLDSVEYLGQREYFYICNVDHIQK